LRIGLTGTIPKDPLDKANLTAGFGPVTFDVKAHELQQRNILSVSQSWYCNHVLKKLAADICEELKVYAE
jgi:hypothetical protein